MKGSPAKMGTIQGTAGHASALRKMKEEKMRPDRRKMDAVPPPISEKHRKIKKQMEEKMNPKGDRRGLKGLTAAELTRRAMAKKKKTKGPKSPIKMKDLSGDGKITKKDVLIGRGVIKKDSPAKAMKKDSPTKAYKKSPVKKDKGLMEKLIPSASTRDKIKGVGKKISDAYTYAKGVAKDIHRVKRPGERYNPVEAGKRELRAKKRGVNVKSYEADASSSGPLKPAKKTTATPQQMVKGYQKMMQKKKDAAKKKADTAKKKADKIAARKKFVKDYQSYNR